MVQKSFLIQQDDFLWAKYAFYDAYCEAIQKQGHLTKRVRQILESLARKHGKQYIASILNMPFLINALKGQRNLAMFCVSKT